MPRLLHEQRISTIMGAYVRIVMHSALDYGSLYAVVSGNNRTAACHLDMGRFDQDVL